MNVIASTIFFVSLSLLFEYFYLGAGLEGADLVSLNRDANRR